MNTNSSNWDSPSPGYNTSMFSRCQNVTLHNTSFHSAPEIVTYTTTSSPSPSTRRITYMNGLRNATITGLNLTAAAHTIVIDHTSTSRPPTPSRGSYEPGSLSPSPATLTRYSSTSRSPSPPSALGSSVDREELREMNERWLTRLERRRVGQRTTPTATAIRSTDTLVSPPSPLVRVSLVALNDALPVYPLVGVTVAGAGSGSRSAGVASFNYNYHGAPNKAYVEDRSETDLDVESEKDWDVVYQSEDRDS